MEEAAYFLRIFISTIFFSTSLNKIFNFTEHIVILKEYKLFPNKHIKAFALTGVCVELIGALLFIIGYVSGALILLMLLMLFSLGIILNLVRGRKHIDCGCGGLLGEKQISWQLVFRNIFFALIIVFCMNEWKYELLTLQIYKSNLTLLAIIGAIYLGLYNNILKIKRLFSKMIKNFIDLDHIKNRGGLK